VTRAADAEPRRGEARLFAADEEVGRDLAAMMRPPYGDGIRKMLAGQIKA